MTLLDDFERDEFADMDAVSEELTERDVDDAVAEKAMRALRFIDRELARKEALAAHERSRIDRWLSEVTGPLLGRREFFERCLETYCRANFEQTGTKSVKLPSGTVALRKTPDRVETIAEEPPERFARIKVQWDKHAVKERTNPGPVAENYEPPEGYEARVAVDLDGQVVEGVVWLLRTEPAFSAKPLGVSE